MSDTNNSMYGRSTSIPVVVTNKAIDFNLAFPGKSTFPITMDVHPVNNNNMLGTVEAMPVTKFTKVIYTSNDTYVRSSVPLLSYYDKATLKAGILDDDIYKAYISFANLADQDEMIKKGLLKAELVFVKTAENTSNIVQLYALENEFEQDNVNYNVDLGNAGIICTGVDEDGKLKFDITSHMRKIMKGEVIDKGFGLSCDDGLIDVYSSDSTIDQPEIVLTYYDSSKNHRAESIFASIKTMVQPVFDIYGSIEIEQDKTEILGSIGVLANDYHEIKASLEAEEPIHYGKLEITASMVTEEPIHGLETEINGSIEIEEPVHTSYTEIIGSMVTETEIHNDSTDVDGSIEIEQDRTEILGSIKILKDEYVEIKASLEAEEPIHYGSTELFGSMITQKEILNDALTINASIDIEQDMTEINSSITLYGEDEDAIQGSVTLLDFGKSEKPFGLTLVKQDISAIPLNVDVIHVSYMNGSVYYEQENSSCLDGSVLFIDEKEDNMQGSVIMVEDLTDKIDGSLIYLKDMESHKSFGLTLVKQDVAAKQIEIDFRVCKQINGTVSMSVDGKSTIGGEVLFVADNETPLTGNVNFLEDLETTQQGSVTYLEDKISQISGIVSYTVDETKAINGSLNFLGEIEESLNGHLTFINTDSDKIKGHVTYEVNNMRFINGFVTFVTNDTSSIDGIVSYSVDDDKELNGSVIFEDESETTLTGHVTLVIDDTSNINGNITMVDDLEDKLVGELVLVEDKAISLQGQLVMVDDVNEIIDGRVTFLDSCNKELNGTLMMELSHDESIKGIEFTFSKSFITTRIIEN